MSFADKDQVEQNIRSDLDQKCMTLIGFLEDFFEKVHFDKISRAQRSMHNYPTCKELDRQSTHHFLSAYQVSSL